jgi:aspartate/methionine/tyrosine aminotransferase
MARPVTGPASVAVGDQLPGSGIREIVNLALTLDPASVARLEIGEPDFRTPGHIVEAAHLRALAGVGYTQSAGLAELRALLAERILAVSGVAYEPDDVIVTAGGVQACSLVMSALLSPGDEVLVPDPAWPNYEMLIQLHGAIPVRYPLLLSAGYVPDPEVIRSLITDRTKLLIVNSPGNPTGAVLDQTTIRQIVEIAVENDVLVLSDEVYDEIIFAGTPANAIAIDPEHVMGLYSFSKTYAMTGWRVGYVAAPRWLRPALWKVQEALVSSVSEVSQAAAMAALRGGPASVAAMRESYRIRRDLVVRRLAVAGIPLKEPEGAFYVMIPLSPGADSRLACLELVTEGVALAPGSAFGDVAFDQLRLSLSASEETISLGLDRLLAWYERTGGGAHLVGEPVPATGEH